MNHFCTYFDRRFLTQGLALAGSLKRHAPDAVLWVLCLDADTESLLHELNDPQIKPVALADLEAADPQLAATKGTRSLVEYYFTLSPCWPRYLLKQLPPDAIITYVDADMYFFSPLEPIFAAFDGASVLITEHRYPEHLRHHERCGRFNVGILCFRNDEAGRACLDDWRQQCLEWCRDCVEGDRYADQKYLDAWPQRLGASLRVLQRPGVNLAPWNWSRHRYDFLRNAVLVDGLPLELFHFARFRATWRHRVFQSGQLEYGVMPWRLRQRIYGPYWRALQQARKRIERLRPALAVNTRGNRGWHGFWRALVPRLLFGSDWFRIGPFFVSGRFGLGRFSGQVLAALRQKPATPAASPTTATPVPASALESADAPP